MRTTINEVSQAIIGAAIEVHRALGPGLLESAYEQWLSHEFSLRQIPFERQKPLHVDYKGTQLDCGYRLDFLVAGVAVVEVKAIEALLPIHHAQLLSYLKLPLEARTIHQLSFRCSGKASNAWFSDLRRRPSRLLRHPAADCTRNSVFSASLR